MEKHFEYHIDTNGLEQVLVGAFHMIQMVQIGRKCRVVLEYDPALPKAVVTTFVEPTDISGSQKSQEKPFRWVPYDSMQP